MSNPLHSMPFNVLRHMSWDRAPRVDAIALYLFPTAIAAGGTAAFLATAFVYVGVTAVTSWAINALTPRPRFGSLSSSGILVNTRDPAAAHQFVYGEMRKGGTITYLETTGETNEFLHLIVSLAGHPVDQIGDILIDDQVVTIDGSGNVTDGFLDGDGNPTIRIQKFDGTQTTAPADLLNESELTGADALTSGFVGNGIAYLYIRLKYDQSAFPNGIPLFTAVVRGKRVFDPRTSTTVWSDNAALCIRDYLTSAYGLSDTNIDETAFSAAANICDETVATAGAGNVKRYTINGIVTADTAHGEVLNQMVTACAGTLFWGTGKWKLTVADYVAPTKTLTLDDLRSGISLQTRTNLRDQFNTVQGTFINAAERWITQDYPPIIGAGFVTEDGDVEQSLDLALPFTTDAAIAQRLAKLTLFRGREQMTFSAEFGMNAFDVEVGEIIDLDMDRYGFAGKEFEVIGWQLKANQDAGDLRVMLTLRETSEAAFDWNAEEEDIIANNTTLPSFNTVPAVTFVGDPVTETIIRADGGVVSNAVIEWNASDDAFVDKYVLRWRKTASTDVQSVFALGTYYVIPDVETGVSYTIDIAAMNALGVLSPRTEKVVTFTADVTAPSAPTPISATGGFQQITVRWTNPSQKDLKEVEVYANTSNTTSGASIVGKISGDTFVHSVPVQNTTRYYFLKAVDFTGNTSGFSTGFSGTTLADPQNGTNGTNGDTGDTIVTGRVYYQILQASSPSTPSASSYNVATGTFSGLTANWALTQPSVDITDTSVQEWSSQFQVTIDGVTSAQTISFTSPSGAIQVTADIESDNYVAGVAGWKIERDTGNAEFQDAIIRGTLNAADITAGTLNADRINIDGVSLDTSGGQLIIKDLGVTTGKINTSAVTTPIIATRAATDVSVSSVVSATLTATGSLSLGSFSVTEQTMILIQSAANCYGTGTGTTYSVGLQLDGVTTDVYLNSVSDSYATFDDLRFPVQVLVNRIVSAGSHTLGLGYVIQAGNTLELNSLDVVVTLLKR